MRDTTIELKVGIFAIVVIIFLSYMTLKVVNLPMIWEKGYRLYVEFDDVSGLDEQSRIKIAGVDAGIVEKIELVNGRAKLTLLLRPDITVYENATASLRMTGLLGDRYLALSVGTPDRRPLKNGDTIKNVTPVADLDALATKLTEAANNIGKLSKNIGAIFGDEERNTLRQAIQDLRIVMANLKEMSVENKEPVRKIILQLESLTTSLSEKGPELIDNINKMVRLLAQEGPSLIENLNTTARELREVIGENREEIRESVKNIKSASHSLSVITERLEKGKGTLGKLMKDEKLYESIQKISEQAERSLDVVGRLRTFVDFYGEYNTEKGQWKGYFDLTLKPRMDKYYILGVVSDPEGSVETTERVTNGVRVTEEETTSKIEFSAQFARRFHDLALRIGLMENTFGFGADYFFDSDRGRIKFDIWDFAAKEAGADRAHARLGVDYILFKYLFISGGIDNILNSSRRGIYVGGGLKFEDEDLKYLLGSFPSPF